MQISSNPAFQIFTIPAAPVDESDRAAPPGSDADFAAFLDGEVPEDSDAPATGGPEEALFAAPASPAPAPMPGLAIAVAPLRMDLPVAADPEATVPVGPQPAVALPESPGFTVLDRAVAELSSPGWRNDIAEPLGDTPDASPPSGVPQLVNEASPLPVKVAAGRTVPDGSGAGVAVTDEAGQDVPNPARALVAPPIPDSRPVDVLEKTLTAGRPAEKPFHTGSAASPQMPGDSPPINRVAQLPDDWSAEAPIQPPPELMPSRQTTASPVPVAAGKNLVPGEGRPGTKTEPRGAMDGFPLDGPTIGELPVRPPGAEEPVHTTNPGDQVLGQVISAGMRPLPMGAKDQSQELTRMIAVIEEEPLPPADTDLVPAMPTVAPVDQAPIPGQVPPPGAWQTPATAGLAVSGGEGYFADLAIRSDPAPTGDPAFPAWTPRDAALATGDIGGQIARALPEKPGAVELTLTPEELGRIRFEIQQSGDLVRMVLTAERPETMEHLRRHLPEFLADLRQAGFSGSDISFGQWSRGPGDNTPAWSGAFQDQGRNRHGSNANSWSRGDGGAAGGSGPAPQSSRNLGLGPGQLAIRV